MGVHMDAGMISGAALGVLDKVLEAKPEGDYKSEALDVNKMLDADEKHKTMTKHYKVTKTQTLEVEHSEHSDDETAEHQQVAQTKTRHRSCFGKCFGKK